MTASPSLYSFGHPHFLCAPPRSLDCACLVLVCCFRPIINMKASHSILTAWSSKGLSQYCSPTWPRSQRSYSTVSAFVSHFHHTRQRSYAQTWLSSLPPCCAKTGPIQTLSVVLEPINVEQCCGKPCLASAQTICCILPDKHRTSRAGPEHSKRRTSSTKTEQQNGTEWGELCRLTDFPNLCLFVVADAQRVKPIQSLVLFLDGPKRQ